MLKVLLLGALLGDASALRVGVRARSAHCAVRSTPIRAGLFDSFGKAFANQDFDDRNAKAQHILLKGGDEDTRAAAAETIKEQIESGELTFEAAAKKFSECPSRAEKPSGTLGQFSPGKMVAEFDAYVFNPESAIGAIGIVESQFGTHLVRVNERK